MSTYPETISTEQYLQSDCYKVATFAFSQTCNLGSLKALHPIDPTLWEITEEAKMLGCLPVITFVPREAALAVLDPTFDAANVPKHLT